MLHSMRHLIRDTPRPCSSSATVFAQSVRLVLLECGRRHGKQIDVSGDAFHLDFEAEAATAGGKLRPRPREYVHPLRNQHIVRRDLQARAYILIMKLCFFFARWLHIVS